ncbi:uncharacterized protein LOC111003707 [Pieris rapae]|uniref:uncharacterized protein LOC111003707 n=1 Tax=Pieris rapae TaxID=64459 RepID=UPI000B927E2C|nr:uncharacterized protein LOC111003707 [Pieris rapae]
MTIKIFTALLFVGLISGAPTSVDDDEKITIDKDYYPRDFIKYEGTHDIISILVPLNSLNFDENESSESNSNEDESNITVFFVEADIDEFGKLTYQGLYNLKDGKVKKILENGRDAASSGDSSRTVYLAASDGLYTYKEDEQIAVKYGSLTDSIIGIAHIAEGNILYILTDDHTVYEVQNNGNDKSKLEDIFDAQQIVLDYSNNLYFYTSDKKVHVKTTEGIKDIVGLPENSTKITLIKPPFIIEDGIPVLVDNVAYIVYSNGTSENSDFDFKLDAIPSAFGMEAALIQYYAYDKKIYEYNILLLVLGEILDELKNFLSNKTSDIQSLAANRRASLRSK